ncbi:hypothetical protein [Paenibacillus radicis (ex Xue et al. 2023)]|uniref:ParA family protein n=1 Tax=Paenibacillus radicis (ex Xue et al. 2023) TaxID=2972489 RepID=A0ABT1YRN6_9BACL|nr:hypothetical protein [Paenibacillus radicis (ex Xue et al. 2023)]MCR8635838.1 hypothetical protein [Paenibacillus radicis (ex Xue et al. 2023)]
MKMYAVSADRRLLEALRLSRHYDSVTSVTKEMVSVLLMDESEQGWDPEEKSSSFLQEGNQGGAKGLELTSNRHGSGKERTGTAIVHGDVWLVSDTLLDIHEAVALRRRYPANRLIYMLSNHADTLALKAVQTLCAAHGMHYVLPYRTPEQVAEETAGICLDREKTVSKVITVIGALPQTGLTSSLIGLGVMLSRLSGVRIGILGMNGWNPGDSGLRYNAKYLDELWGSLQGKQLQAAELHSKMQQLAPRVHYMAGNRDLKKLYYYQTDGVSWLIEKARECFDIVLIDAGSYVDHALAAQSIHVSDLLLVQMHQGQQARTQWRRMHEHILQPVFRWNERQTMLLFNKMHRSPNFENEKQLSRQMDMSYIGSLPYVASFHRSEAESNLLNLHWPEYDKELQKVSQAIMHYYSLPSVGVEKEVNRGHSQILQGRERKVSWFGWMKSAREA